MFKNYLTKVESEIKIDGNRLLQKKKQITDNKKRPDISKRF